MERYENPLSDKLHRYIEDLRGVLSLCDRTLRQYIPPEDQKDSLALREIARVLEKAFPAEP